MGKTDGVMILKKSKNNYNIESMAIQYIIAQMGRKDGIRNIGTWVNEEKSIENIYNNLAQEMIQAFINNTIMNEKLINNYLTEELIFHQITGICKNTWREEKDINELILVDYLERIIGECAQGTIIHESILCEVAEDLVAGFVSCGIKGIYITEEISRNMGDVVIEGGVEKYSRKIGKDIIFQQNYGEEVYEGIIGDVIVELIKGEIRGEEMHKLSIQAASNSFIENSCHSLIRKYSIQIIENESVDLKRCKYYSTCLLNKFIQMEIQNNYVNILSETAIENAIMNIFKETENTTFECLLIPQILKTHILEHTLRNSLLQMIEEEIYSKKQQEGILEIAKTILPEYIDISILNFIKEITIQQRSNETNLINDSVTSIQDLINNQINSKLCIISTQVLQEEEIINENRIIEYVIRDVTMNIAINCLLNTSIQENIAGEIIRKSIIEIYKDEEISRYTEGRVVEESVNNFCRKIVENEVSDEAALREVTPNLIEAVITDWLRSTSKLGMYCDNYSKNTYEELLNSIISNIVQDRIKVEEISHLVTNEISTSFIENQNFLLIQRYSTQIIENEFKDMKICEYLSHSLMQSAIGYNYSCIT